MEAEVNHLGKGDASQHTYAQGCRNSSAGRRDRVVSRMWRWVLLFPWWATGCLRELRPCPATHCCLSSLHSQGLQLDLTGSVGGAGGGGADVNPSASWAPLAHYESCNCISDGRYQPVVVFYVMMLTLLWNYTLRMPQSRLIHTNSHLSEATHNLLVAMTRPVIVP